MASNAAIELEAESTHPHAIGVEFSIWHVLPAKGEGDNFERNVCALEWLNSHLRHCSTGKVRHVGREKYVSITPRRAADQRLVSSDLMKSTTNFY